MLPPFHLLYYNLSNISVLTGWQEGIPYRTFCFPQQKSTNEQCNSNHSQTHGKPKEDSRHENYTLCSRLITCTMFLKSILEISKATETFPICLCISTHVLVLSQTTVISTLMFWDKKINFEITVVWDKWMKYSLYLFSLR